jgi:hypothetical protein
MRRRRTPEEQALHELDLELTEQLERLQPVVLAKSAGPRGRLASVQSLHGLIGGKNNTFVDSVRTRFSDPEDFFAQWIRGLLDRVHNSEAARRLVEHLKDPTFLVYTQTFLTRNFYRNLLERTRAKPSEQLWSLWFGANPLVWGLIIAPALRGGQWTNDVSEVRRASYKYWTVGHVMATGLIDPSATSPILFSDLSGLLAFYASILSRVSRSPYEKEIARRYAEYLEASPNPLDEPFLVPELRYAGAEVKHKYRLDYAILNSHVMEFVGFELSPASTHMAVSGTKSRTQADVNRELAENWAGEMRKRNDYFAQFGITTITFADPDLANIGACFGQIKHHLRRRPRSVLSLAAQIEELLRT